MNDQWTNRLSAYIDGELDNTERVGLENHLATCGRCYATLSELREVITRAKSLEDSEPAADLWPGIAQQIRRERLPERHDRLVRRRFSFTVGQLLAASIALVLLSTGGVWMALRPGEGGQPQPPLASPAPSGVVAPVSWKMRTDAAIAELQDALTENEGKLDTATVRVVRENLAIIDRAIGQAQRALRRDPGNTYLNLHLANTMRQKIELLRRANALAAGES